MRLAIETAKQGRVCFTQSSVGCVILDRERRFLSRGAHLKWGEGHAEINAVNRVGDPSKLREAVVYVTLEPCAHRGKTSSCARFLAELPIKTIYYAVMDPNPEVSGRGLEILKTCNKEVVHFKKYESQCKKLCEQFFFHIKNQRPFVALKIGASLDGKIALQSGQSQWITGEKARGYGRKLRAYYDATLVGAGTVLQDDPTLNFRETEFEDKKDNHIILFDPRGKIPDIFPKTRIGQVHSPDNIFVLTSLEHTRRWSKTDVQVIAWTPGKQAWQKALCELYGKGLSSVFVEGGAYVLDRFCKRVWLKRFISLSLLKFWVRV